MKITITRITKEDIEGLEEVFLAATKDNFTFEGFDIEQKKEDIDNLVKEKIEAVNKDLDSAGAVNYFLAARFNGRIIGVIAHGEVSPVIKDELEINYNGVREILCAYVLPEFQGQGIGTLLFNQILISLLQIKCEGICLYTGSYKGKPFWTNKLGEPDITIKDYFEKEIDCYIWYRKLYDLRIEFKLNS